VPKQRVELVRDQDRRNSYLLSVEGVAQSYVDLDNPGNLELEYIAWFADVIDAYFDEERRLDVVHLGAGACSLARYLASTRPRSKQKAFDIDPEVVAVAFDQLGVGEIEGLAVTLDDAREAITTTRTASLHLVITDVYVGPRAEGSVLTVEALSEVRRTLRPTGLYLANVADRRPFEFVKAVVAAAADVFEHVAVIAEPSTIRGRRYGNLVIAAADRELPIDELRRRAARAIPPTRLMSGARLSQWIEDVPPMTDATPVEPPVLRSWIYDRSKEM
jgi:spermidine synthase